MDEILSLLFNPDFQFGAVAGASLASAGIVTFVALLGVLDKRQDRRRGNPLDEIEHFQRTGDAIFYGDLPAPPRVAEAANDATLDLREAYRRPRSARAEMQSAPR